MSCPDAEEEEEEVAAPQAKAKKGKKKAVSNFAALAMEEEDDPELQVSNDGCITFHTLFDVTNSIARGFHCATFGRLGAFKSGVLILL